MITWLFVTLWDFGFAILMLLESVAQPLLALVPPLFIGTLASFMTYAVGTLYKNRIERVTPTRPARMLRLLIDITTPRQEADALLGDLEEGFKKRARKQGKAYAHAWYTGQALRSVGPLMWAAAKRLTGLAAATELFKRIR